MAKNRSVNFAIGTRDGRRSSVWKFFTHGNEAYIASRMFAYDAKISLHSSGECQYSRTDRWVRAVPGRRNSERHMIQWFTPRPVGTEVYLTFRVQIPESELTLIPNGPGIDDVVWLPAPHVGFVYSFNCYVTPPIDSEPVSNGKLPHRFLTALPLGGGRWFVVLEHVFRMDQAEIEDVRKACVGQATKSGYVPEPRHRLLAFSKGPGAARGMIEMSAISRSPVACNSATASPPG